MSLVTASSINFNLLPPYRVVNYYIYDIMNKDVAAIQDILVDADRRVPRYVIVEIGGFLAIRGKKILVPWNALKKGGLSRMDVNCVAEHIIYAPSPFDPLAPTAVEEESVHRHFNVEPYWVDEPETKPAPPPTITTKTDTPVSGKSPNAGGLKMEKE